MANFHRVGGVTRGWARAAHERQAVQLMVSICLDWKLLVSTTLCCKAQRWFTVALLGTVWNERTALRNCFVISCVAQRFLCLVARMFVPAVIVANASRVVLVRVCLNLKKAKPWTCHISLWIWSIIELLRGHNLRSNSSIYSKDCKLSRVHAHSYGKALAVRSTEKHTELRWSASDAGKL